jgi:hypothetical protein
VSELLRIHVETLFTHDAMGRMVRVNEPAGKAAPRFYLGRSVEGAGLSVKWTASPLYSTSWENRAARGLAEKLGPIRCGTDLHIN